MIEKAGWVRAAATAAGRDPSVIELNMLIIGLAIGEGDDLTARRKTLAQANGIAPADLNDSSFFLTGSGPEIRDRVRTYRDRAGITYFSLFDPGEEQIETFAEQVITPLAAHAS